MNQQPKKVNTIIGIGIGIVVFIFLYSQGFIKTKKEYMKERAFNEARTIGAAMMEADTRKRKLEELNLHAQAFLAETGNDGSSQTAGKNVMQAKILRTILCPELTEKCTAGSECAKDLAVTLVQVAQQLATKDDVSVTPELSPLPSVEDPTKASITLDIKQRNKHTELESQYMTDVPCIKDFKKGTQTAEAEPEPPRDKNIDELSDGWSDLASFARWQNEKGELCNNPPTAEAKAECEKDAGHHCGWAFTPKLCRQQAKDPLLRKAIAEARAPSYSEDVTKVEIIQPKKLARLESEALDGRRWVWMYHFDKKLEFWRLDSFKERSEPLDCKNDLQKNPRWISPKKLKSYELHHQSEIKEVLSHVKELADFQARCEQQSKESSNKECEKDRYFYENPNFMTAELKQRLVKNPQLRNELIQAWKDGDQVVKIDSELVKNQGGIEPPDYYDGFLRSRSKGGKRWVWNIRSTGTSAGSGFTWQIHSFREVPGCPGSI